MIQLLLVFNFLWIGSVVVADADISLIQDLVGTYPVVEYLGNPLAAGKAEIFVTDTEVGVRLIPLNLASYPVVNSVISSPKKDTLLRRDSKGIYQTFEKGAEQVRIDYLFGDGILVIDSSQCTLQHCVKENNLMVSRGGAPGAKVETQSFLKKVRGNYSIERAGGEPVHGETNTGEWIQSEEPGIDMLRFPFCQPTGCDPGFLDFIHSELSVFQKGNITTVMAKTTKKMLHFSWEEKGEGTIIFTNYQFKLLTKEIVGLEYVLRRN